MGQVEDCLRTHHSSAASPILHLRFSSSPPISLTHLCADHSLFRMPDPRPWPLPPACPPGLSARWQGLTGTSGACPLPLLSFIEAAPLGHEARGRATAVGGRELHSGRGDRRGGREFSQTHSQPGNCGKAGRSTDQEQGLRELEAGLERAGLDTGQVPGKQAGGSESGSCGRGYSDS